MLRVWLITRNKQVARKVACDFVYKVVVDKFFANHTVTSSKMDDMWRIVDDTRVCYNFHQS